MASDNLAEKDIYTVYQLGEITYLPHYSRENVYVAPGYDRHTLNVYTVSQLIKAGAMPKFELLLTRVTSSDSKKIRAYERSRKK